MEGMCRHRQSHEKRRQEGALNGAQRHMVLEGSSVLQGRESVEGPVWGEDTDFGLPKKRHLEV